MSDRLQDSSSATPDPGRLRAAARSVFVVFLLNGALFGSWVSRIPAVQRQHDLSEAELGLALACFSIGVLSALSVAGAVVAAKGSRSVTLLGLVAICCLLPLLGLAPNPLYLGLALFLLGGALSVMDVAMNAQAVTVEHRAEKPLMSTFHGAFSLGGLLGALVGAAMAGRNVALHTHFAVVAALFGVVAFFFGSHLLANEPPQRTSTEDRPAVFSFPPKVLWPLGLVALISSIAEGSMGDWSGVYLVDLLGVPGSTAALGFAAYSSTMTLARFAGDTLQSRFSAHAILRWGGITSVLGLTLVVTGSSTLQCLLGFAITGLGLANIIPIVFRAAGNHPSVSSGHGIAAVATIGYAGFLAGPPAIGFVAEVTSLRVAMLGVLGLCLLLVWLAPHPSDRSGCT